MRWPSSLDIPPKGFWLPEGIVIVFGLALIAVLWAVGAFEPPPKVCP